MNTNDTVRKSNRRSVLKPKLERSLALYTAAAAAACVGLLSLSRSAEAKVVYTPAHTSIPNNSVYVLLDLNGDGIPDFRFQNAPWFACCGEAGTQLNVDCVLKATHQNGSYPCNYSNNEIWAEGPITRGFASALRRGVVIGANKQHFRRRPTSLYYAANQLAAWGQGTYGWYNNTSGQWNYTKGRYVGLQFVIGGQVHYGWARLSVLNLQSVVLTGYAYETIPNKPIVAGNTKGPDVITMPQETQSATLGGLARGAATIPSWRNHGK